MRIKIIVILIIFLFSGNLFSQDTAKTVAKPRKIIEGRNNWGLNLVYTDRGFGLSGNLYKALGKDFDFQAGLTISGLKDANEFEQFDYYGNSYIYNKLNRVFLISFNAGIHKYLFSDELAEGFKPLISIGVSPTLVLTNPYEKNFFSAFGYMKNAFALGGYAGVGMEYKESNSVAFSLNIRYSYIPIIGDGVQSIINHTINEVGGIQLIFGVNFLK
jgi:hypothetical protein